MLLQNFFSGPSICWIPDFQHVKAVLIAFLATEEEYPPVGNLKELINSDYRLAVRKGTSMESIFLNAIPNSEEYHLNKKSKITRFSEPADRFIDLMVEKNLNASKTILFDIYEVIQIRSHYPCKLSQIKGSIRKAEPLGMVFTNNWPWAGLFNHHLLVMKESGLMERLYQLNMKKLRKSCPKEYTIHRVVKELSAVGTNKTYSLYVALAIGFAASLLFLLFEKLAFRHYQLCHFEK